MSLPYGNLTVTAPLEQYIISIFILVAVVLLVRYLIAWFVTTLTRRGIISLGTKSIIVRILDIIVVITIILVIVQLLTGSLAPYVIVTAVGILLLVLFYYEIKEFTAFISLQLQKYAKEVWIEAYFPNISKPFRGRIVEIEPFSSVLEDLYGKRVYVSNSMLVSSIIREYRPVVVLKITVRGVGGVELEDVLTPIKEAVEDSPFRLDLTKAPINSLGKDKLSLTLRLIPLSTPIRSTDLYKLMKKITSSLSSYDPHLEIIE